MEETSNMMKRYMHGELAPDTPKVLLKVVAPLIVVVPETERASLNVTASPTLKVPAIVVLPVVLATTNLLVSIVSPP